MKTLKNDTRYIIKRVLIGVLIAIVLFNARKCGVYAYTNEININGNTQSLVTNTSNLKYLSSYEDDDIKINYYMNNTANFTDALIYTFNYSSQPDRIYFYFTQFRNVDLSLLSHISLGIARNVDPYSNNTIQFPPNIFLYNTNNDVCNTATDCYNNNYFGTGSAFNNNGINRNYNLYYYDTVNHVLGTGFDSTSFSNYYKNGTISIRGINKDIPLSVGSESYVPDNFPPSGYSELSLKDYQGVVFVPKNYNDIQCSVVGDLCNTTFDYYYQEEIKEAYFPLDNRFNIRFNSDFLNSPNEPSELKSTYFPISQVSVNETFYYAFMIYNYTNDGSPLDPENYYAYGDAKVWYDSTLWNYYLVDDFNTWSANVCYMLDGNEVCTTISGLPTLKDAIEQAQLEDNILGTHVGDLNLFSSIIRFPLGFVQSLSSESCTSIQLPPLPFIGGNISLPCMSLIYQQVLGIYQPVISGFINFIIIYYLIVALIKFYNKTFDPSHTEIEVIDL